MVGKWQLGFFKDNYLPWKRGFDEFFGQLLGKTFTERFLRNSFLGGQDYYSRRKCLKLRNYGNLCGYDLRTEQGPVRDTSMKYQPFLYADKGTDNKNSKELILRAFSISDFKLARNSLHTTKLTRFTCMLLFSRFTDLFKEMFNHKL